MRLHQPAVAALAQWLERDQLLGGADGRGCVAGANARVGEGGECRLAEVGELASFRIDPVTVLAGEERSLQQRGGQRVLPRDVEIAVS